MSGMTSILMDGFVYGKERSVKLAAWSSSIHGRRGAVRKIHPDRLNHSSIGTDGRCRPVSMLHRFLRASMNWMSAIISQIRW
jgi:hypothetical protein